MPLLKKILPRLSNVLEEIHRLVKDLHFDSKNRQHILAGALLGRILEEADGIYALLERSDSACGFILLRSILEAHVDLLNMVNNPTYAEYMHAAFLDQQRLLLETALERGSKSIFLAGLLGSKDASEHLNRVRSELRRLNARQIKPLKIRERFKNADQLDYYEGPYAQLCGHSHNNINVLESRHVRITSTGARLTIFNPMDDDDAILISDTMAGISANSLAAVKKLLEGEPVAGLENLTESLEKFRESLAKGGDQAE